MNWVGRLFMEPFPSIVLQETELWMKMEIFEKNFLEWKDTLLLPKILRIQNADQTFKNISAVLSKREMDDLGWQVFQGTGCKNIVLQETE